jgi:hypothetical protein
MTGGKKGREMSDQGAKKSAKVRRDAGEVLQQMLLFTRRCDAGGEEKGCTDGLGDAPWSARS